MRRIWFGVLGLLAAPVAAAAFVLAPPLAPLPGPLSPAPPIPTQLPGDAEPISYDLTVAPDAKTLRFTGRVAITLQVPRPTRRIVLNAAELAIHRAGLDGGAPANIKLDAEEETAAFSFARPVAPGRHVLTIDYTGTIHSRPAGLFKLNYDTPAGRGAGRMLLTQFEPADARRFVPSFDEPAKKAVFHVSAVVPAEQMALSNMPETSVQPLPGGLKRVRFAPTPRMSSYLLFFGVGDLERISQAVDGTRVGVVIRRGDLEKGRYALQAGTQLLRYYNSYFGVKYPLPKLDLIAAPGDTGGAMENWGAAQFQQTYLVIDPKLSTDSDRQEVFNVVAHEMAHQWFGDLVTMAWWDDLWLNEAFASWMASKASDHFHPEWKPLLWALSDKDAAMRLDARSSSHPIVREIKTVAQSEQAFDAITYQKGEAVLRMLEAYTGEDAWARGVRAYMVRHAYRNTRGDDLWAEMDRAARLPVSTVAHDFTRQAGVPLVRVETACTPTPVLTLTPGRLSVGAVPPPVVWRLPLAIDAPRPGVGGALMLFDRPQTIALKASGGGCPPVVVNAGQSGYVRVGYSAEALRAFQPVFARLPPADQIGLLNDTQALGLAGRQPLAGFLDLFQRLEAGNDAVVWDAAEDRLLAIDAAYPNGPQRQAFRAWAITRLRPVLQRAGFDRKLGEGANFGVMRQSVITALSRLGDPEVIAESRRRFEQFRRDPASLSAATRRWVVVAVARQATPEIFDALLAMARASADPLEQQRLYEGLAVVRDPVLAQRVLDLSLSPDLPANIGPRLVTTVGSEHPELAWRFVLAYEAALAKTLDALSRTTFVPQVAGESSDPRRIPELQAWADKTLGKDDRQEVAAAVARIRQAAEIELLRLPEVNAWIAIHPQRVALDSRLLQALAAQRAESDL